MSAITDLWTRIFFPAMPVRRLALLRIAIATFGVVDMWFRWGHVSRYSGVDDEFAHPVILMELLGNRHSFPPGVMTAIHVAGVVALLGAALGLLTRASLAVGTVCYTLWFAVYHSHFAVEHGQVAIAVGLAVLTLAPSGDAYAVDRRIRPQPPDPDRDDAAAGWAIRMIQITVVTAYFVAGVTKLRVTGFSWPSSGALQEVLIEKDTPVGLWFARHEPIVVMMGWLTLVLEVAAPLVWVNRTLRNLVLAATAAFHVGTIVLLNIDFYGLMLCYLAFFDLEVGVDRARAWWERRGGAGDEPVVVAAGGGNMAP